MTTAVDVPALVQQPRPPGRLPWQDKLATAIDNLFAAVDCGDRESFREAFRQAERVAGDARRQGQLPRGG